MDISVDPVGITPPYEQVRAQIEALIRAGELARGTRLQTVRRGRNGTFVLASRSQVDDEDTRAAATAFARAARRAGISLAEATEILSRAW